MLAQLERFAPGVRDLILARAVTTAAELAARNPAAPGGDGLGGAFTLRQAVQRPTIARVPWRTPVRGVYLASAATPPGPGVHGMAGWHAAATALADATGRRPTLAELFASH